jgi:hypothetical protein
MYVVLFHNLISFVNITSMWYNKLCQDVLNCIVLLLWYTSCFIVMVYKLFYCYGIQVVLLLWYTSCFIVMVYKLLIFVEYQCLYAMFLYTYLYTFGNF